jgi:uncharacterized protein
MVIENHPRLDDGSPFPTTFWLTCPLLVKRVSALEARGFMTHINDRLRKNVELRSRLAAALERYSRRRNEHEVLPGPVSTPGGGPDRVKCLHAHVAHELADGPNPAGAIALAHTGFPDCAERCVTSRP